MMLAQRASLSCRPGHAQAFRAGPAARRAVSVNAKPSSPPDAAEDRSGAQRLAATIAAAVASGLLCTGFASAFGPVSVPLTELKVNGLVLVSTARAPPALTC
jgi:hypothetical protein